MAQARRFCQRWGQALEHPDHNAQHKFVDTALKVPKMYPNEEEHERASALVSHFPATRMYADNKGLRSSPAEQNLTGTYTFPCSVVNSIWTWGDSRGGWHAFCHISEGQSRMPRNFGARLRRRLPRFCPVRWSATWSVRVPSGEQSAP